MLSTEWITLFFEFQEAPQETLQNHLEHRGPLGRLFSASFLHRPIQAKDNEVQQLTEYEILETGLKIVESLKKEERHF